MSEDILTVQGFEKSEILSNEDVAEHLSAQLPKDHSDVRRVKRVEYTDRYVGDESAYIAGRCITNQHGVSRVEINRQSPEGSHDAGGMKQAITHEVGHNVYYNLHQRQREEWRDMHDGSARSQFVSDYARITDWEDFAESYRAYVHDPERLKRRSPAKYEFMYQSVFEGREYR